MDEFDRICELLQQTRDLDQQAEGSGSKHDA